VCVCVCVCVCAKLALEEVMKLSFKTDFVMMMMMIMMVIAEHNVSFCPV